MTTAIQPGRPETITLEQEIKLKAFWNATLTLFGQSSAQLEVPKPDESTLTEDFSNVKIDQPEQPPGTADSETSEKTKSKRRYFGLSSSSKKDKKDKKDEKDKDKLQPPASTISATPSPPPGLTADPEDKYNQGKDFKAALASQTPEQLRTTFWGFVKYDNPDALLLRFLRARKWDVDKALVMMVSTMHWRGQEVFVEDIVHEGELGALVHTRDEMDLDAKKHSEGFLHQLRVGKSYIHGTDKENRPMCIVSVRLHRAHEQSPESLERYTIYLIETTRLLLKHPTDTAAILFDMTGFGMSNMDYAPVKFMIKCFEAHYPECLGICLVHNAPWIFQGIWKIIKGWLDPVVASKVHFTTKVSDLAEFIPLSHLPKSLGGEEDWTYEYKEPVDGENPAIDSPTAEDLAEKEKLETERTGIIEEYEKNTRDWIKEESKGSSEPTDVKDERSGLRERLKGNYWGLDRFYRATTYYDRIGMVKRNGEVDFYPTGNNNKKEVEEKVNGDSAAAAEVPKHSSDDDDDVD
ncbi:Patellin-4 [Arthrobotrys entomopaga]|nr:Patellin-4 [Arthrobotrys entomopaga]